ncbi:MAG: multiheme c-type cytochrome, partial [Gemmataceae bacterium]
MATSAQFDPCAARQRTLALCAGFVLAVSLYTVAPGQPPEARRGNVQPDRKISIVPLGNDSCAGSNCHSAARSPYLDTEAKADIWKFSIAHLKAGDKHRKAYDVLSGDLAKAMMAHLAPHGYAADATQEVRCLACHVTPSLASPGAFGLNAQKLALLRDDGVGCEACHGPASRWVDSHSSLKTPDDRRGYFGADSGMVNLNDIVNRSRECAGCHVGAPADTARGYPVRDMNHDMIAAGHPRLNFDRAQYTEILRPHW